MSTTSKASAAASSAMFRQSWQLYQKMVHANNGMNHNQAYASLHKALKAWKRPFSFVDLACGDAQHSVRALQGTQVQRYTGIDLSETALSIAGESIQKLPKTVHRDLVMGDFREYETLLGLDNSSEGSSVDFDVVWIGLSLHHLATPEKASFLQSLCHNLSQDGMCLVYEPICLPQQTREDYYRRFQTVGRRLWSDVLTAEDFELLFEHVATQDIPESEQDWLQLGQNSGFSQARVLYRDPHGLYSVFSFGKVNCI